MASAANGTAQLVRDAHLTLHASETHDPTFVPF